MRRLSEKRSRCFHPSVAVVQCCNVGYTVPADSPEYIILSESVDFSNAFMSLVADPRDLSYPLSAQPQQR